MTSKKQVKTAARKLKNTRRAKNNNKKQPTIWAKIWYILCWPCKKIAKLSRAFWNWICGINLIGLLNSALLISIIVLFSMLILDFTKCKNNHAIVIVTEPVPVTQPMTDKRKVIARTPALPVANKKLSQPVNVVPVKKSDVKIAKKQTAIQNKKMMGDVIIDSRGAGALLQNSTHVNGNIYIQNMHKFTLPCDITVNGNMFLRDIGLLQFCGKFTVTGNIYVSPRSSFGPIPKNARIGGYVVL